MRHIFQLISSWPQRPAKPAASYAVSPAVRPDSLERGLFIEPQQAADCDDPCDEPNGSGFKQVYAAPPPPPDPTRS